MSKELSERRSKRFWVLVILGFFALDLSIAAIAITMAAGDPSFRSIPGYGERAVSWNERQALQESWRQTGFRIDFDRVATPNPDANASGSMPSYVARFRVTDAESQPVTGLLGTARLFHYTRVAKQFTSELLEQPKGVYVADIDVSKDGLWSIELELKTSDGRKLWIQQEVDWTDKPVVPS